jgi:hypothetical protein
MARLPGARCAISRALVAVDPDQMPKIAARAVRYALAEIVIRPPAHQSVRSTGIMGCPRRIFSTKTMPDPGSPMRPS